jgi:hypothetical protein
MYIKISIAQLILLLSIIINEQSFAQGGYGRPTEIIEQRWDLDQARWENDWRTVYEYSPGYEGEICSDYHYPGYSGKDIFNWSGTGYSRKFKYTWSGTDWGDPDITIPTYDSNGNMIGWATTNPNGGLYVDGHLTGPYCCGHPTEEIIHEYNGISMENLFRYSNTFSPDCDLTREQVDAWNGSEWIPHTLWESTYTEPGCPDSQTWSYWTFVQWRVLYTVTFTYEDPDCMSDQVPYPPGHFYPCNPTSVDFYISSIYGDIWVSRTIINLSGDCQVTSQYTYSVDENIPSTQPYEMITNEFMSDPEWGKILKKLDNADYRVIKSVYRYYLQSFGNRDWRKLISYEGVQLNANDELSLPNRYLLAQNYPNPFNPYTTILYELPEEVKVSVVIYDFLGREVRILVNNIEQPGSHSINWNGKDGSGKEVSAGIYLYQIRAGEYVETRKMVLLK